MLTCHQGVVSDIENRKFHGYPILVAASICLPIVITLTLLRLYVRLVVLRKWALDDCKFSLSILNFSMLTPLRYICIECGTFQSDLPPKLRVI
jgi:hypothetical protein